jgi:hypothetical protein
MGEILAHSRQVNLPGGADELISGILPAYELEVVLLLGTPPKEAVAEADEEDEVGGNPDKKLILLPELGGLRLVEPGEKGDNDRGHGEPLAATDDVLPDEPAPGANRRPLLHF